MKTNLDANTAATLSYLQEMGYGELYISLDSSSGGAADGALGGTSAQEPVAASGDRGESLIALAEEASTCEKCGLCEKRSNVVFGTGNPNADLMFVGEGPGANEDRQGIPFVGAAGQLLDKIIKAIGMSRDEVYIANVVKCRPPGNRDPLPDEVASCMPYLERQIALVQPKVLVALGRVAAQTLLGNEQSISRMRGQWHSFEKVPLRVTYHPAALLYNEGYKRPTWEDMQLVRDRLAGS